MYVLANSIYFTQILKVPLRDNFALLVIAFKVHEIKCLIEVFYIILFICCSWNYILFFLSIIAIDF